MADKKTPPPSFDELKDEHYHYHYSRNDRLARQRKSLMPEPRAKKPGFLGKLFGGNRSVGVFFLFYVFIGLIAWGYVFLVQKGGEAGLRKDFSLADGRRVEARLILKADRRGINVLLNNGGKTSWTIGSVRLEQTNFILETNIRKTLEAGDFDVIFFPSPDTVSNISKMTVQIR